MGGITRVRIVAALAGSAGLAAMAVLGPALTGGAVAAAQECGYYEDAGQAYYNNCESDGLIIRVSQTGEPSYDTCAMPGVTHLGSAPPVRGAYVVPYQPICG